MKFNIPKTHVNKHLSYSKMLEILSKAFPRYSESTIGSELHVITSLLQKELLRENKVNTDVVNVNNFKYCIEILHEETDIVKVKVKHGTIRYFNDTYSLRFS